MSKKKDSKEYKYRRQGSIDDENFLLLAYKLDKIENAISTSESSLITVDLTETNEKLEEIKASIAELDENVVILISQMRELLSMEVD